MRDVLAILICGGIIVLVFLTEWLRGFSRGADSSARSGARVPRVNHKSGNK
jgi:hypothetical protein